MPMAKIQIHANDRLLFTMEAPPGGLRPRLKIIKSDLDHFSGLLNARGMFTLKSSKRGKGWDIKLAGGPDEIPESAAWAGWIASGVLGVDPPAAFGGITGLDGLSLPVEDIKAADFPIFIDEATLGIPHEGLRRGILKLLEAGESRTGQVVVGSKSAIPGADETMIVSRFARRVFADPTAVSIERLSAGTLTLRIGARALPVAPFALPAYAFAVRALFAASLA